MATTEAEVTDRVFEALVNGRGSAKEAAIRAIDDPQANVNREYLRTVLLKSLRNDFPTSTTDPKSNDTRGWLLSALGRVCADEADASAEVRKHLDPNEEPLEWVRYWTLEGLIAGNAKDLHALAQTCAADPSTLVSSLAQTLLAKLGDAAALTQVLTNLQDPHAQWAMLRGLRVLPPAHAAVIESICGIVRKGGYSDILFDSIIALTRVPPGSPHAEGVARTLENFISDYRWPMYDAMRVKALIGLGNLHVARSAPVIVEELSDDSPAVVFEAGRALEKVLGVRDATREIVDAALRLTPDVLTKLGNALRSMDRAAVVEQLEASMLDGSEDQQNSARALLSEVGGAQAFQRLRARTTAATQYVKVLEQAEARVRELFEGSILEARHGFTIATRMDVAVFILGMLLILSSAMVLLIGGKDLSTWVGIGITGGTGVLGVLYSLLIANPRQQVREAVDHLMHLKIVFLGYLRQLHQTDQAYTRRLLEDDVIGADDVAKYSAMVGTTMGEAIARLAHQMANTLKPDAKTDGK
jgi:HEAT repeat protein